MQLLIIQTAFLGDLIISTSLVETLMSIFPDAKIDFVIKKGNEKILHNQPHIQQIYTFDKKNKINSLIQLKKELSKKSYDIIINTHKYLSSGIISLFPDAHMRVGFKQNPLSITYQKTYFYLSKKTEIERLNQLLSFLGPAEIHPPKIHLDPHSPEEAIPQPFITVSPFSEWFTKSPSLNFWNDFFLQIPFDVKVFILGAPQDFQKAEQMIQHLNRNQFINRCGQASMHADGKLMRQALLNYVLDSAPLHLGAAVGANLCAVYCSTDPSYGFLPDSDQIEVINPFADLPCHPCGPHGHSSCPQKHFKCGQIPSYLLLEVLNKKLYQRNNS